MCTCVLVCAKYFRCFTALETKCLMGFLFVCLYVTFRPMGFNVPQGISINPTCYNAVILPAVTRDVNIRFRTILSGHAIAYRLRPLRSHHHESNNSRLSFPVDWYVCDIITYYYCTVHTLRSNSSLITYQVLHTYAGLPGSSVGNLETF